MAAIGFREDGGESIEVSVLKRTEIVSHSLRATVEASTRYVRRGPHQMSDYHTSRYKKDFGQWIVFCD